MRIFLGSWNIPACEVMSLDRPLQQRASRLDADGLLYTPVVSEARGHDEATHRRHSGLDVHGV